MRIHDPNKVEHAGGLESCWEFVYSSMSTNLEPIVTNSTLMQSYDQTSQIFNCHCSKLISIRSRGSTKTTSFFMLSVSMLNPGKVAGCF